MSYLDNLFIIRKYYFIPAFMPSQAVSPHPLELSPLYCTLQAELPGTNYTPGPAGQTGPSPVAHQCARHSPPPRARTCEGGPGTPSWHPWSAPAYCPLFPEIHKNVTMFLVFI